MNVLLIWEEVPDNTKAYVLVPGKDDELIELAKAAHGYFVNGEDNDPVHDLNIALAQDENGNTTRDDDYNMQNAGKQAIPGGPYSAVYICGFLL
jgi:hypothetical protein